MINVPRNKCLQLVDVGWRKTEYNAAIHREWKVVHNQQKYIQSDTKKTGTFEKPNKNWRNPTKKIYWQKLNHYNLPF